LYAPIFLKS